MTLSARLAPQNASVHDRAAGVLLAGACGDALGAGYELGSAPLPTLGHARMIGGGLGAGAVGEWTDDTAGAVAIARGVLRAGGLADLDAACEAVAAEILSWHADGPPDIGNQTAAVLGRAARAGGDPGRACTEAALAHLERSPHAAGNGSLMRTGAVALAGLGSTETVVAAARGLSALTHAGDLTGDACVLWSVGVERAVREGHLRGVREAVSLLPAARQEFWEEVLAGVSAAVAESQALRARGVPPEEWAAPGRAFSPNGYVVTALQAALWAAEVSEGVTLRELSGVDSDHLGAGEACTSLQVALQLCVWIGSDTDTTATICGSLVGARWGASAVPARWRRELTGWPGLVGRDLVSLGVELAALAGAEVEASSMSRAAARWPTAPHVAADDAVRFRAPTRPHPASWDPQLWLGTSATLTARCADDPALPPIDAVVSLSRVGSAERPRGVAARDHLEVWLVDDEHSNPHLGFVLADVADAVAVLRAEGRNVLLHCVLAQHRTPAGAAADAMVRGGLSLAEAREELSHTLPHCGWRESFTRVLTELETAAR